jgi:hypothetical protein
VGSDFMPSWSVHLAIAKKVSDKLKIDRDLFSFGNLIPDTNKDCKLGRYEAHYYNDKLPYTTCPNEKMIDLNHFMEDYKKHITNPLILGYYAHLLTDNFYNNIVYSKCWIQDENNNIIGIRFKNGKIMKIDIEDKLHQKKKYKHKDFELYGKYLFANKDLDIPKNKEEIIKNIKYLKNQFLSERDINNKINYLNNGFMAFNKLTIYERLFKHNYKLFSKQELDKMLDDCVDYVLRKIKEVI